MTILPGKYDLKDREFGFWTVLRVSKNSDSGELNSKTRWLCRCVCGKEKSLIAGSLARGDSKSCGCLAAKDRSQDLSGQTFGRLFVVEMVVAEVVRTGRKLPVKTVLASCLCACGETLQVRPNALTTIGQKSCGCFQKDRAAELKTIHGEHETRLYRTWQSMKQRCQNPNVRNYHDYGGRGIKVCDEWQSFLVFAEWAKANGYDDSLTIERKDVNGSYCPQNCTFIPLLEQWKNRRNTVFISAWGESKTLNDWLKDSRVLAVLPKGVIASTVRSRLQLGWSFEQAISQERKKQANQAK